MDFGALLHIAKKNSEGGKDGSKYYSTKFAPPKKESKEKRLSDNIQKFLQKKEHEEKLKQREQKEKLSQLLSMRDEKSKNKIRKMLKVTKSANRSVLDDAVNTEHTAITMTGPEQPDQDDYGYVSNEANSFYQKYIDKVKDVKEDKGFAPSRPQSLKDLSGTKERVKAAITREIEEKNTHTRTRTHATSSSSSSGSGVQVARSYSTSKPLYDPEAEKRAEEEERKKRAEEQKKAMKNRKAPPPPMDFQALLKLAEKKQHEPLEIPMAVPKKKEPERLLTSREKKEMEERQRAKEAKERRDKERLEESKKSSKDGRNSSTGSSAPRMEPNGRIPKLNQDSSSGNSSGGKASTSANSLKKSSSHEFKKPTSVLPSSTSKTSSSTKQSSSTVTSSQKAPLSSSSSSNSKSGSKPSAFNNGSNVKTASTSGTTTTKNPYGNVGKSQAYKGPTREFPPRDIKSSGKTREFPPADVQRSRQFPPPDVRRGPANSKYSDSKKHSAPKRRIADDYDDDSEYDSELDDFIDDGDCDEDISSHIKAIFGYDKSKYRHMDDDDDRAMESSFAQVQREEYISKKIGIQEDLEDMKQEALEKKRKMMKKRRLIDD